MNVPKLRFGEFFADQWQKKQLMNICDMRAGKFVRASEINENFDEGLYPCFGGNGLRGFTKSFIHEGKYSLIGRQGALCGNVTIAILCSKRTRHANSERIKSPFINELGIFHGTDTHRIWFSQ